MLIGGAGLSLIAVLLLEHEGRVAMGPDGLAEDSKFSKFLYFLSFGGLFIRLSVFQIRPTSVSSSSASSCSR